MVPYEQKWKKKSKMSTNVGGSPSLSKFIRPNTILTDTVHLKSEGNGDFLQNLEFQSNVRWHSKEKAKKTLKQNEKTWGNLINIAKIDFNLYSVKDWWKKKNEIKIKIEHERQKIDKHLEVLSRKCGLKTSKIKKSLDNLQKRKKDIQLLNHLRKGNKNLMSKNVPDKLCGSTVKMAELKKEKGLIRNNFKKIDKDLKLRFQNYNKFSKKVKKLPTVKKMKKA